MSEKTREVQTYSTMINQSANSNISAQNNCNKADDGRINLYKKTLHISMDQLRIVCPQKKTIEPKSIASSVVISRNSSASDENTHPNPTFISISPPPKSRSARQRQKRKAAQRNKYVAMDCEMVGVGPNGQNDMLARVSIVNKYGEVLLDKFVQAQETVSDYRTSVSGIRPRDMNGGEEFDKVQDEVVEILQGKILIGHGLRNDLAVLRIKHPFVNIRDTSRYKPLCLLVANGRTPSLKRLSEVLLGLKIQTGEHSSVEDARAVMSIYNRIGHDWELYLQNDRHHNRNHSRK